MASTVEMINKQDAADAPVWARIKHDVDPGGWWQECNLHPEHAGHAFLSYCVICPEDTGNGKISEAAREAAQAARDAKFMAEHPVPF